MIGLDIIFYECFDRGLFKFQFIMKHAQCTSEPVLVPKCGTYEDNNGGKQTKKLVHSCGKKKILTD